MSLSSRPQNCSGRRKQDKEIQLEFMAMSVKEDSTVDLGTERGDEIGSVDPLNRLSGGGRGVYYAAQRRPGQANAFEQRTHIGRIGDIAALNAGFGPKLMQSFLQCNARVPVAPRLADRA